MIYQSFQEVVKRFRSNHKYLVTVLCRGIRPGYHLLKEEYKAKVVEDDLKAFYMTFVENGTIPGCGIPDTIIITDEIAKTSVGKIDKKELRKQYIKS